MMRLKTSKPSSSTALDRFRCDGLCSVGSAAAVSAFITWLSRFRFLFVARLATGGKAAAGGSELPLLPAVTPGGCFLLDCLSFKPRLLGFKPRLLGGLTVRRALNVDSRLLSLV